jgi:DNA-binding GntR family transcriptional regulator
MPSNSRSTKRAADLSGIAFQRLRQAILTGELKEGERVRESRLAVEWGIGVTPLREAVRRMAEIGHLILQPNHAPVVRTLRGADILEIYALREVLECFAVRRSWDAICKADLKPLRDLVKKADAAKVRSRRIQAQLALDSKLHELWISNENGPWAASILERLLAFQPNLAKVLINHTKFADEAFGEHREILEALQNRDLELTLDRLGRHIRRSGTVLAELTNKSPSIPPL